MIEAVNAVVSNAQILRNVAEQTSTTQTLTANPTKAQSAAVAAPYLSPHVNYTEGNGKPVFVVRDSATGETLQQFPSQSQIKAYHSAARVQEQVAAAQTQTTGGEAEVATSVSVASSGVELKPVRQVSVPQSEPVEVKSEASEVPHEASTVKAPVKSVDTKA